jgi:hypothetical protein
MTSGTDITASCSRRAAAVRVIWTGGLSSHLAAKNQLSIATVMLVKSPNPIDSVRFMKPNVCAHARASAHVACSALLGGPANSFAHLSKNEVRARDRLIRMDVLDPS